MCRQAEDHEANRARMLAAAPAEVARKLDAYLTEQAQQRAAALERGEKVVSRPDEHPAWLTEWLRDVSAR
jgi:hypothetical protein